MRLSVSSTKRTSNPFHHSRAGSPGIDLPIAGTGVILRRLLFLGHGRRRAPIAGGVIPTALLWGILASCGEVGPIEYASPGNTYETYVNRLLADDTAGIWQCYSEPFRLAKYQADFKAFEAEHQQTATQLKHQARRREIIEERIIGDRIGFVRFDATTLPDPRTSHFFYFILETDGWKVTSYLDSTFHAELEQAIERGDFDLSNL